MSWNEVGFKDLQNEGLEHSCISLFGCFPLSCHLLSLSVSSFIFFIPQMGFLYMEGSTIFSANL